MKKFVFCCFIMLCCFIFVGCHADLDYPEVVNEYSMDLEYVEEDHSVKGSLSLNYVNQSDTVQKSLKLHLYPNAFRQGAKADVVSLSNTEKAYPNGKSYGRIDVEKVMLSKDECEILIEGEDENILTVPLKNELYPDDRVEVKIEFTTYLANINHRLGYGDNAINICNFYPIACVFENGDFVTDLYNSNGDPFYSKISNYSVSLTYPSKFVLASSGLGTIEKGEEKTTANITAKAVRDFGIVLSENFKTLETTSGDVLIEYQYIKDGKPEESLNVATEAVSFFSEKFGAYPYKKLTVVETNFVHGGMEYPNLVLISDDLGDYETYRMVIVHEICHQWWYGVVGNNQFSYGWIDEGLTEFSTALFYDNHSEYGQTSDQIVRNATQSYLTFMRVYSDVLGEVDTSMNRKLSEFNTEPEYVYNTYTKGMLMFASIKEVVGEKTFYNCLSYYYKKCAYKEVTPEMMISCFVKASNKNLENIFTSWLEGKVVIVAPE